MANIFWSKVFLIFPWNKYWQCTSFTTISFNVFKNFSYCEVRILLYAMAYNSENF